MTIKRIIVIILGLLILSIGGLTVFVLLKEDVWKTIALNSINKNLSTEMTAGELSVRFISTFPNVSVKIDSVQISDSNKKPLLEVETLVVAFSVWEVLWGDPVISRLYIENGEISLEKYTNNTWNYEIAESSNDDVNLELNTIELESIDITYTEQGKETSRGFVKSAHVTKNIASVSFADLTYGSVNEIFQPLYGEFTAEYNLDTLGCFTAIIESGVLNDLSFDCEISSHSEGQTRAKGNFFDVSKSKLESVFVDRSNFEGWSYGGRINIFFNANSSSARIDFALPQADFAVAPSLTGLSMNNKGLISGEVGVDLNFKSDQIGFSLKDVVVKSNGLSVALNGETPSYSESPLNIDLSSTLDLSSSYHSWIPNLTGETQNLLPNEGELTLKTVIRWMPNGNIKSSSLQIEAISMKGMLNSRPYTISNLFGKLKNDILNMENVQFNWAGNVGGIKCRIRSFDSALNGGAIMGSIDVDAESTVVDPIMDWWENMPDDDSNVDMLLLPHGSDLKYNFASKILLWEGLECNDSKAKGSISSNKLRISLASSKAFEGEGAVSGMLRPGGQGWTLGLTGSAEGFLFAEMFRVYENFGQEILRAEHMEGRGEVAGTINMVWDAEGNWVSNALDANLNLSVSNGRLKKMEVFDEIADYLKENRLIAPLVNPEDLRNRLADIDFEYVETPISVANSIVSVPIVAIHTSAMDVSLEGDQSFAGSIDYTLGFALRDLKDDKQGEFDNIQDDGLGTMFFLGMDGTLDEPEYSYDREAAKAHRRKARKAEFNRIKNAISGGEKDDEEKKVELEEEGEKEEDAPKEKRRSWRKNTNDYDILDNPEDDDF